MTFEGGFLLAFAFIFGLPLLLLLARFIGWLTGTKTFLIRCVLLAFFLLPVAASFYLDMTGRTVPVTVVDKSEIVKLTHKGSWSRTRSVAVEYEPPGEINPVRLWLGSDAETFDSLRAGQTIEVRLLDLGEIFKFARLKNRSTLSLVTGLFPRQPRGPWQQATAVVRDVRHISDYQIWGHHERQPLRWPYDVVELSFVPEGREQAVSAVDVIERGSVPELVEENRVQITWPADDPRAARLVGARPGAPWANWFYVMMNELLVTAAFIGVLLLTLTLVGQRRRRRKQAQT
jgi:hypothetical protein